MLNFTALGRVPITSVLSDVVYRIQMSSRSKPKVVHSDRLKPYLGPPLKSWLPDRESSRKQIVAKEVSGQSTPIVQFGEDEAVDAEIITENQVQNSSVTAVSVNEIESVTEQQSQDGDPEGNQVQVSNADVPKRPTRRRRPPDRYGSWVS